MYLHELHAEFRPHKPIWYGESCEHYRVPEGTSLSSAIALQHRLF